MAGKPASPAQRAAYVKTGLRMKAAKLAKVARLQAERDAEAERSKQVLVATNEDRVARGLTPIDFTKSREAVSYWTPPPAAVVFGPVLANSQLVDHAALESFGLSAAVAGVFFECGKRLLCRGWLEGTDYSVSAAGLCVRVDLWDHLAPRIAQHEADSKARIRSGKPKSFSTEST
jgi:hypothetical protein